MATQDFDKLNNRRSMPFEKYFGEMGLSESEIERRIAIAEDWDSVLMYILALYDIEDEQKLANSDFVKNELFGELMTATEKHFDTDKDIQDYIKKVADDFIDVIDRHPEDEYYRSEDRAMFVAEDQANAIGNYIQYKEAQEQYSHKIWMTLADEKVRMAHLEVDHQEIPINEYFIVGGYQMRYPHDFTAPPHLTINCRCWCVYR